MKHLLPLLLLLAAALAPGQSPAGKGWLAHNRHDGGRVFQGTKVSHRFPLANPRGRPVRITGLTDNCACAGAWLVVGRREITGEELERHPYRLPPGGRAEVKVLLDMTGIRGTKEARATLFLAPEGEPKLHLDFFLRATAVVYFRVEPAALSLGEIGWGGTGRFAFTVSALPAVGDWRITGWGELPPGVKLAEPVRKLVEGRPIYHFSGTLGPLDRPGRAGGVIRLETDFRGRVLEVDLRARVRPPLHLVPRRSFSFGLVRRRRGKEKEITVTCRDRTHRLKLLGARFVELSHPASFFAIEPQEKEPGRQLGIKVRIKPGAPAGRITGALILEFNHPRQRRETLRFSAFVR